MLLCRISPRQGLGDRVAGRIVVPEPLSDRPSHHRADAMLDPPGRFRFFVPYRHQHAQHVGGSDLRHGFGAEPREGVAAQAGPPYLGGTARILPGRAVEVDDDFGGIREPRDLRILGARIRAFFLGNAGAATKGRDPRLDFNASSNPTFGAAVEMSTAIRPASRRDGADSTDQQPASLRITPYRGWEINWRLLSPRQKCHGFQRLNGTRRPG